MNTQEIYELAISQGVKADLRSEAFVQRHLDKVRKKYEDLREKQKFAFDQESLTNP